MNLKIDLPNEKATKSLGLKIAQSLPSVISDMTVVLKGEMGAGKSTIVRSVLRALIKICSVRKTHCAAVRQT